MKIEDLQAISKYPPSLEENGRQHSTNNLLGCQTYAFEQIWIFLLRT